MYWTVFLFLRVDLMAANCPCTELAKNEQTCLELGYPVFKADYNWDVELNCGPGKIYHNFILISFTLFYLSIFNLFPVRKRTTMVYTFFKE